MADIRYKMYDEFRPDFTKWAKKRSLTSVLSYMEIKSIMDRWYRLLSEMDYYIGRCLIYIIAELTEQTIKGMSLLNESEGRLIDAMTHCIIKR